MSSAPGNEWRDELVTKKVKDKEVVLPIVSNVIVILRHHPEWRGVLAWDAFGDRVVTRRPCPWHPAVAPSAAESGVFRETDITRTVDWIVRTEHLSVGPKMVMEAIPVVAEANSFHPVREYLDGLEWDGVERLPKWLSVYCGVKQSEYSAAVGTKWMISAVARPFEPGCQVDCMLVLEGPQGIGKSSAFRTLVPDRALYSETGVTIGDKDSYQSLHGIWIYVHDELDSLNRSDVTRTKNFLSSPKDHYRPSYGHVARDYARQNVFGGTTNLGEYLIDRTGNRRIWPARSLRAIDIDAIARDRDQLWAEAFARYARGERWHTDTPALRALCEAEQAERVHGDPWEDIIARWLSKPRHRLEGDNATATGSPYALSSEGVTTTEILAHAIGKPIERITRADEMRIADALRALGYERGRRVTVDGVRAHRYVKVSQERQTGGSDSKAEKKAADPLSDTHDIRDRAHTQRSNDQIPIYGRANPGVTGVAGSFADDIAELGIGVAE